jgi:hypothetical protein
LDTTIVPEYTSNPSTPVAAKSLQQELVKATQAMRQIPSRANSVSDYSDDEDTNSVATKTTPKSGRVATSTTTSNSGLLLPMTAGKSCSGKGRGKRRTSMVQTGLERDLQASSMDMSETER